METIKKILSSKNNVIFILLAICVALLVFNIQSCQNRKNKELLYKQNTEAQKNEITVKENKIGELQSSIVAFNLSAEDLKKINDSLYREVKNNELKGEKVKIIIKTELVYANKDTLVLDNKLKILPNNQYGLQWNYVSEDSDRQISGDSYFGINVADSLINVIPGKTKITTDIIKLSLVVGVKKNNKTKYDEIFVTPKNSNVSISSLEGAIIDGKANKKSKYSVGVSLGYGISVYNNQLILSPYLGIGVSKNIINF